MSVLGECLYVCAYVRGKGLCSCVVLWLQESVPVLRGDLYPYVRVLGEPLCASVVVSTFLCACTG